jgi:hypothetical protein
MIGGSIGGAFEEAGSDTSRYSVREQEASHLKAPKLGMRTGAPQVARVQASFPRVLGALGAAALVTYATRRRRAAFHTRASIGERPGIASRIGRLFSSSRIRSPEMYENAPQRALSNVVPQESYGESTISSGEEMSRRRGLLSGFGRSRRSQSTWDPATRAFLGTVGTAMAIGGARQRKPWGYALSALGAIIGARAGTAR